MRTPIVGLWLAGTIPWVVGDALAFECKASDRYNFVAVHWNERSIPYRTQTGIAQDEFRAIEDAFGAWSGKSCTDLDFRWDGPASAADTDSNIVRFVDENWVSDGTVSRPARAVAVTLTTFGLDTGIIRRAVIEVNRDLFDFADITNKYDDLRLCSEDYDLISVLTHEVGHFIGLDHTREFNGTGTDPTMAPVVGSCEANKRTLEADDVSAICLLYPEGQGPGSCLPLPVQDTPYVRSTAFAFGCQNTADSATELPLWLLWPFLMLVFRRTRAPFGSEACPRSRSGG